MLLATHVDCRDRFLCMVTSRCKQRPLHLPIQAHRMSLMSSFMPVPKESAWPIYGIQYGKRRTVFPEDFTCWSWPLVRRVKSSKKARLAKIVVVGCDAPRRVADCKIVFASWVVFKVILHGFLGTLVCYRKLMLDI